MKICAIICEFNPFHNGHAYILNEARKQSGCDALVCVMSGQFTQRGEMCRTDKFLRSGHAILGGADAVIELYTPFAVAPAEIFARGAVKLISELKGDVTIAFGCEDGKKEDFLSAAKILTEENQTFKEILARQLESGESYIKSCSSAFKECGGNPALLSSPNNILGAEYAKAVLKLNADIDLLPIKRVGGAYDDSELKDNFSSAGAIRANADSQKVMNNMPEKSYRDFIANRDNTKRFEQLAADYLYICDKENLKRVYGCTEGLENRLKKLAFERSGSFTEIVKDCCSKRYTAARIRRIVCANLLGLYADETELFLGEELWHKPLAVKKEAADKILPLLKVPHYNGENVVDKCGSITSSAYSLWKYLNPLSPLNNPNEKMILV